MTDTLQLLLMFAGLITKLITGTIAAGDPSEPIFKGCAELLA